jgi:gliding motility-associated-like protein
MLLSLMTQAQQFVDAVSVNLPDSAVSAKVQWVELNNDVWPDVFVWAENSSGENFFITYEGNPESGPKNPVAHYLGFRLAAYRIADFDSDNDMDIIVSGIFANALRTSFFENQSDFKFVEKVSIPVAGAVIHFADINSDAIADLILSGKDSTGPFFNIYRFAHGWNLVHDSLKIEATAIEIFDFDNDGDNDIFISGKENNRNVSKVLTNQGTLYFKSSSPSLIANGKTSVGDLNHDGYLDIFLTGVNASGQNVSIRYLNNNQSFIAKDTLTPLSQGETFLGDFNSDGKCDIQILGKTLSGDTLNVLVFIDSATTNLNKAKLHDQTFGDYDRDGDLDMLQVLQGSSSLQLRVGRNDFAAKNEGPKMVKGAFGFVIFNRLFLHWGKGMDDHTPDNAITYDITMHTKNAELLVGEFDLLSSKRLTVSHGNAGTRNYSILKPAKVTPFTYTVQGIDNSFETRGSHFPSGEQGVCSGSGVPCESREIIEVAACKNETLTFNVEFDAQWFSLSKGFLAEGASYEMEVVASDTIFSFSPGDGCPSLRIYLIKEMKNFIKKTTETRFVCEGQTIPFNVESDWANILWKSQLRGNLGTTSSITYVVSQNDSVTVQASNDVGCSIEHKAALPVSKPEITLEGDVFQILKGESVQFSAGGGETYHWTPEESLDESAIGNPTATPLSSTIYTVTVYDSIGCTAMANVQVVVEGTAFVPNLFTPNDDGKNDEVKVYGLPPVSNFNFVIHNREGSVLYETKDVSQASNGGWDGTSKGIKQPGGVYYWKVGGEHPSGRKLLLNGKTTGSIVLIR